MAIFAGSVRAEPATAPAESKPAVIASVTVGSLNQLSAAADDLEITLPPFLTAPGIEQTFQFIGADGMRKELPVSIQFLVGGNIQSTQQAMFFLPLVAGHAPITTFIQQGQAIGNDAALVNGMPFRRVGNYLIWGGTADIVTAVAPEKLPDARQDSPLLELIYDGKMFRQAAPQVLENYRTTQLQQATAKSKSEQTGQRVAIDAMTRGLDRLLLRLEKKDDQFRLTTQIEPSPTFTAREFPKPGLPENCAFRLDWQPPHDWIHRGIDAMADMVGRDELFKDVPTAGSKADFEELIVRVGDTVFGGDEATYGMELLDDGPVFYAVTQSSKARDVAAEFADILHRADAADPKHKKNGELANYKLADGTSVSRFIGFDEKEKPEFYIDSIDKAGTRMTTVAKADAHLIDRLIAAPSTGTLTEPATGWIDGKKTLSLIASFGKMNAAMNDQDHELLNKVLKAQRINWTVNSADNRLNIIFGVPIQLVKNISQNTDGLQKVFAKMNAAK